jgi:hypothetical protein
MAQSLCPTPKPSTADEAPELRLSEKDLTLKKALEATNWLEKDVWEVFNRYQTTEELVGDTEGFGIPFPNSVMIAKAFLLRQQALLERERLEIAALKLKMGQTTEIEVQKLRSRFAAARRSFCSFLRDSEYVD